MFRSIDEICAAAEIAAVAGGKSGALQVISSAVGEVVRRPKSNLKVLSSKRLDEFVINLGRDVPISDSSLNSDLVVFLVTALYPFGGHSRVMFDLLKAERCSKAIVLISNFEHDYDSSTYAATLEQIGGSDERLSLEVAPVGAIVDRIDWMQQRLASLRPSRTYLLQHHQDVVCVASAQPELCGTIFYIHHCDHDLALGVHIPGAVHVDLTAKSYFNCMEAEGVKSNVFWPIVADVQVHRRDTPFFCDGHLRTATSGTFSKFSDDYLYRYSDVVPVILKQTMGSHVHIGDLPNHYLQRIYKGMDEKSVSHDRFVHIPAVRNVAETLVKESVDLYIGSFPFGGGRAAVEAMGAGMPLAIHANYRTMFFSSENEVYPEAMIWQEPSELLQHLLRLDDAVLRRHAVISREYYEVHHSPQVLRTAMDATLNGRTLPTPRRPRDSADHFQTYLDEELQIQQRIEQAASQLTQVNVQPLLEEIGRLGGEQKRLLDSVSWRMTAPLRYLRSLFRN